jgi:hypothetical protein
MLKHYGLKKFDKCTLKGNNLIKLRIIEIFNETKHGGKLVAECECSTDWDFLVGTIKQFYLSQLEKRA